MTVRTYWLEAGQLVDVEVPEAELDRLIAGVCAVAGLQHGQYEAVSFASTPGVQRFRVLDTARNAATKDVVDVPCVSWRFFVAGGEAALEQVLEAIYDTHPYEEPVIYVHNVRRGRHVAGTGDDNPNRFWNRPSANWVPDAHRN